MNTLSNEIAQVARAALDYIDALPPEVVAQLPTMPGFDRDWAEDALRKEREAAVPVAVVDIQRGRGDGRKYALCYTSLGHSLPDDVYNLYAAPPAQPVAVPDELLSAMEEVLRISDRDHEAWHRVRDGIASCRAAMLKQPASNSPVNPVCWCRTCRPVVMADMRFVVCPECGNKRCPKANDHRNVCSGSNEPGQDGSAYPAAPGKEG